MRDGHGYSPVVADLSIRAATVQTTKRAIGLRGNPDAPIRRVTLTDVDFGSTQEPSVVENGVPMQIPADSRAAGQDG